MDFIPGGANTRFVFIHMLLFAVGVGTWCTYLTLRRDCRSISRLRTYLILTILYVACGVVYLMILQSSTYRAVADAYPWAADAVEAPVWLFCLVDRLLAPHAGGTALHALLHSFLANKS